MQNLELKEIYKSIELGLEAPADFCLGWLTDTQKEILGKKGKNHYSGKVREMVTTEDTVYMLHTDRLSAFDKHICHVPGKGIILSQLSRFWFEQVNGKIENHYLDSPHQRLLKVKPATPFKFEVIVRGYITGSVWRSYSAGQREISGNMLAEGLENFTRLPTPILTPSTKAEAYSHDEPISPEEIVKKGLASKSQWEQISSLALELFRLGSQLYQKIGWILVDTKYEFGLDIHGNIMLIDELHTPDSSRLWRLDSYEKRLSAGEPPEMFDKEVIRNYLMESGYMGEGPVPVLPPDKLIELVTNYLEIYENLTKNQLYLTDSWENHL